MDPSLARDPSAMPDSSPEKQSELKLNVGIGALGTLLSLFVTVVFVAVIDELVLGILFGVVTLVSLVLTLRFRARLRAAGPAEH